MNKIDIKNINKELAKRSAADYTFDEGGELTEDSIRSCPTDELKRLVGEYKKNSKAAAGEQIKAIVDELFAEYADEGDNCVILGSCCYDDDSRCVYDVDEPLKSIDFDGFGHKYNEKIYPIGRGWDLSRYDYDKHKDIPGADDDKLEDLNKKVGQINGLLGDLGVKNAHKYYEDDNDSINELWCGTHAVTRDHKIVTFVIRNDGMLCNDEVDTLCAIK